jgi:YNFM family putative membrane transporter
LQYSWNVPAPSPAAFAPSQIRAIALLAVAGFASQAMVRTADSLLPQIASDLAVSVGAASVIVSGYTVVHGSVQLIIGPIGDHFGKYRSVAFACTVAAVFVGLCGLTSTLTSLTLARIAAAAFAGWIIPLGMAYVGDVVPYERRQQVLGRYLTGQITGQLFGQAAGGILGDLLGWRGVFFVLAAILAVAALALIREIAINPVTRPPAPHADQQRGMIASYSLVLSDPWARIVILAVFVEATFMWGPFAYLGADLRHRFDLSFTSIGLVIGAFGLGGLLYAATVAQLVGRLGQVGLATYGSFIVAAAYLLIAFTPVWWLVLCATPLVGLGLYMLHNTLQTNATQMTPNARGTAVALFSSALYLGQTAGVALGAPAVDRGHAPALFACAAVALLALGLWFAARLRRRPLAQSKGKFQES